MNHSTDPIRPNTKAPIAHDVEQAHMSTTDKEDLNAAVHNANIPIEDDTQGEEIIYDDDVPQEYTESYGTGVKNQQI